MKIMTTDSEDGSSNKKIRPRYGLKHRMHDVLFSILFFTLLTAGTGTWILYRLASATEITTTATTASVSPIVCSKINRGDGNTEGCTTPRNQKTATVPVCATNGTDKEPREEMGTDNDDSNINDDSKVCEVLGKTDRKDNESDHDGGRECDAALSTDTAAMATTTTTPRVVGATSAASASTLQTETHGHAIPLAVPRSTTTRSQARTAIDRVSSPALSRDAAKIYVIANYRLVRGYMCMGQLARKMLVCQWFTARSSTTTPAMADSNGDAVSSTCRDMVTFYIWLQNT